MIDKRCDPILSRRGVLAGTAALGALAGGGIRPARAAEPKRGGLLRVGFGTGSTVDDLDPSRVGEAFKVTLARGTLRNNLTEISPAGELVPELAESWDSSPDAKTWQFKIRQGVTFHNGKPLTAEDVVASIDYHRGETNRSGARSLLADIEELRTDGPNGILVRLKRGNADFPFYTSIFQLQICPLVDGKPDVLSGNGTGPYVLKEFAAGVRATGTRNPNYFRADKAWFDAFEFRALLDATARTNALLTNAVDVVIPADLQTIDLIKRRPGIEVYSVQAKHHHVFPMRVANAPFENNDVRLALKYAFNREAHITKILKGFGGIGNDQPISPSDPFYARDIPQRPYDPDRARFHLKQAGLSNLEVSLSASDSPYVGCVDACTLFREYAAPAGITVNVVREPQDGYYANVWMKRPFLASYWVGRPTADMILTTVYSSGSSFNETGWKNERFDTLLNEARSMLDHDGRAQRYAELQRMLHDTGATIIPAFSSYVGAHSNKLAHGAIGGNAEADDFKIAERWWFA